MGENIKLVKNEDRGVDRRLTKKENPTKKQPPQQIKKRNSRRPSRATLQPRAATPKSSGCLFVWTYIIHTNDMIVQSSSDFFKTFKKF